MTRKSASVVRSANPLPRLVLALACWGASACGLTRAAQEGVRLIEREGKLRIEIGGDLFSEYHYRDVSRPFLYPILGPGGARMTRDYPMVPDATGEDRDHPHHRSLWWTHGDINGHDFWSEGSRAGKTVHQEFLELTSGPDRGVIRAANQLVGREGAVVATTEHLIRVFNRSDDRLLDFEITVHASHGELTFGDTKEGTMGIRLAETMRLRANKAGAGAGHVVNSEGVRDGATWGKRATWVDYYGPVQGQTVGVAIFDHPQNPRHPTWWHVRDYGLFAANPFGIHDFERKPAGTGNLVVPAGQSVTFRYRFYFHRGDETAGRVADRYAEYVGGKP
ncbi:MAG: hypothetical protein FJ387_15600 [Verrucomicrobia bacterium]|nr:hypothetical protein [Verrucomicrobiota bacterium]